MPRLMLSVVDARKSRLGVGAEVAVVVVRKALLVGLAGVPARGVNWNLPPSGAAEEALNIGRGDATAEKFVALTVLLESLLEGPCGRSKILRVAICAAEARLAGLSGDVARSSSWKETRGRGVS